MKRISEHQRVSVIIPAYNAECTLPRTLTALRAAAPSPFEIIVVNDASSDATAKVADSLGVSVLSCTKNGGAATAKNHGAAAAHGDILLFIDSDVVPPGRR